MLKTVYEVNCWWRDDIDDTCRRYVVATSDEEVGEKMEKYARELKLQGYADLHWHSGNYQVEMDYVID